jgi:hypothetical protein
VAFEKVMSAARMSRYKKACAYNTRKAMELYRYNLRLSQEMFTVISCFEVALRNAIDRHCTGYLGSDWLKDSISPGGTFYVGFNITNNIIADAVNELGVNYTHTKLVAKMDFGFWRYMFSRDQYKALGQNLLQIFPAKPLSNRAIQYNQVYIFRTLAEINAIRNRIAHHEPICFKPTLPVIDTTYARRHYNLILQLFQWMTIDEAALLYGLDHITAICDAIDSTR